MTNFLKLCGLAAIEGCGAYLLLAFGADLPLEEELCCGCLSPGTVAVFLVSTTTLMMISLLIYFYFVV